MNSRARALASALASALGTALGRAGDRALARALDRALDRDLLRDIDLVGALNRAFNRVVALDLLRDRGRGRDLVRDLERVRDLVRDLDRDLALGLEIDRDLVLARIRAGDLVLALEEAVVGADQLANAEVGLPSALGGERTGSRQVVQPGRSAARVTRWALRWLPVVERARYHEELFAELYDLAESGVSRRAQLGHAVRLFILGWFLRRELRAPSPAEERVR